MVSDGGNAIADLPIRPPDKLSQPLVLVPPLPSCEVCVIVPVRNEAQALEATLLALANQIDLEGRCLAWNRYEVILLANNCIDDSAAIAHRFASQHSIILHIVEKTLPDSEAYIGRVRQLLMDEAYRRLMGLGQRRGVIASTDGDTRVAPTWIAANLYEIACGADAVGGRIVTDHAERAALDPYARSCHLREVGYRFLIAELETYLDPDTHDHLPRHYQHYGASLAVTAQMYRKAGGMPPVRTPEDVAFYRALVRVNARFRHSPLVRVTTSARQTGRTNMGLANQLHQWAKMGSERQPFLVKSAAEIETQLHLRHQLRQLWWRTLNGYQPTPIDIVSVANKLAISPHWLSYKLKQPQSFNFLFEQVEQRQQEEGKWQQRWGMMRIEQAIADLRLCIERLRRGKDLEHLDSRKAKRFSKFFQKDQADTVLAFDLPNVVANSVQVIKKNHAPHPHSRDNHERRVSSEPAADVLPVLNAQG